ncbi:TetR/AcrR family transcriptional regulator [Nonomuraea sp. NBC_01738]|uniref:TetR/AcrR family transcriptional regulator n=1 Tax=Nonomuraea sp. NBC_01738 TaxID=2976003 RepID=UPI002E1121B2|nr:TetR/AcrR family transcriptional regulator [Nonomuraea sp. NBC_01738]
MPVAFTENDRKRITVSLLDTAETLFAAQGLKKTSLDELVAPAGIAKGSFYAFFDSKESLYKDVMIRRAPLVARRLADPLAAPPGFASLVALMRATAEILTTDPLYRRLYTHPGELAAVARKIGPAEIAEITPHLLTPLIGYFARGQRDDVLVADIAPEVLVGVVRTVGLVVLEGDEAVVDATIRTLARGLLA